MTPRPQFDAAYIEAELQELGAALNTEITAFLIGGVARYCNSLSRRLSASVRSCTSYSSSSWAISSKQS